MAETTVEELVEKVKNNPDLTVLDYMSMLDRTPRPDVTGLGIYFQLLGAAYEQRFREQSGR